ncbi:15706_t:CDS:1, partial [Rhizophagus irregularis]
SQKKERNVKNTEISDIEDNEIDSEEEELNDTTKTKKKINIHIQH